LALPKRHQVTFQRRSPGGTLSLPSARQIPKPLFKGYRLAVRTLPLGATRSKDIPGTSIA